MKLLAAKASTLLEDIDIATASKEAIVKAALAQLPKKDTTLFAELRERYGPNLVENKHEGHRFSTFVKIYGQQSRDEEMNGRFDNDPRLINQFIFETRTIAKLGKYNTDVIKLHKAKKPDDLPDFLKEDILREFKESASFTVKYLEVQAHMDPRLIDNFILEQIITSAHIENKYNKMLGYDDPSADTELNTIYNFISKLPGIDQCNTAASLYALLLKHDPENLELWEGNIRDGNSVFIGIVPMLKAALGFYRDVPNDLDVKDRKAAGEVEGSRPKAPRADEDADDTPPPAGPLSGKYPKRDLKASVTGQEPDGRQ